MYRIPLSFDYDYGYVIEIKHTSKNLGIPALADETQRQRVPYNNNNRLGSGERCVKQFDIGQEAIVVDILLGCVRTTGVSGPNCAQDDGAKLFTWERRECCL